MTASFSEFGATLRSWRDRLTPEEVGLPPSAPRRAPGLRRQEVAQLAGVSLDYLVQLEQGRAIVPSPQVLTALARALRLTETERGHLFRLAGQPVPDESRIHDTLPGSVRRLVEQLPASPAAVYDVRWNPIAWNAMWVAVMGDPLDRPERERNMAWRYFTGLPVRVVRSARDQLEYEETIAADLRSSSGRYPGDRRLAQLIADLRDVSPRFCRLWEARRVGVYDQERKIIDHPELGLLHLDCDIYSPPIATTFGWSSTPRRLAPSRRISWTCSARHRRSSRTWRRRHAGPGDGGLASAAGRVRRTARAGCRGAGRTSRR